MDVRFNKIKFIVVPEEVLPSRRLFLNSKPVLVPHTKLVKNYQYGVDVRDDVGVKMFVILGYAEDFCWTIES